jgi:16S rRNA processing protein RimM
MAEQRVLVGAVIGAHGIKGEAKVKTFTADPRAFGAYGPVATATGRVLRIVSLRPLKDADVIVTFAGVSDRTSAENLKGAELYVPRSALPVPENGEFYHADLVGLSVEDDSGAEIGKVRGVQNFGAGDLIEIEDADGDLRFVPFTVDAVPVVDIAAKKMVVRPPRSEPGPDSPDNDLGNDMESDLDTNNDDAR